jgi:hypothetical protein
MHSSTGTNINIVEKALSELSLESKNAPKKVTTFIWQNNNKLTNIYIAR